MCLFSIGRVWESFRELDFEARTIIFDENQVKVDGSKEASSSCGHWIFDKKVHPKFEFCMISKKCLKFNFLIFSLSHRTSLPGKSESFSKTSWWVFGQKGAPKLQVLMTSNCWSHQYGQCVYTFGDDSFLYKLLKAQKRPFADHFMSHNVWISFFQVQGLSWPSGKRACFSAIFRNFEW